MTQLHVSLPDSIGEFAGAQVASGRFSSVSDYLGALVTARNRRSGRKMSDAIFVAKKVSGRLKIGDKKEIDKAAWCKPRGIRLTATSRYIRDKLFPR